MIQNLTEPQKRKLAELLLACPAILDKGSRESLLQQLPEHIAGAIKSHDAAKTHVLNIVNACANYQDGLEGLLEALRFFDDKTHQFSAVIAFLEGTPHTQPEFTQPRAGRFTDRKEDGSSASGVDQQKQRVGTQYNAGGDINTQAREDVIAGNKTVAGGDVTHISGIPPKEYQALSKELGVRQIALENFFEILDKGAVPSKDLDRELREVAEKHKEFLSRDFERVMEQSKLTPQIQAKHEFTHHSKQTRELIKKARRKLKYLPSHPDYLKVMLMGGTVLSSAGELREAKKLLHKALDISTTEEDKGLIRFNLFQINIRCRDYRKALDNLQEAIKINPGRYALHDVKKYPIERLLGAGGMGAVFLCSYPLKKKKVAVKCLWEKREGADKEAAIMAEAAGKYVPAIIDYDYSGSERAYFVTEYAEGAIDGAAWLKKHGKLTLADGLEVGRQIAEALQSAHEKGIFHLDLKPANILLKRVNRGIEIKVIDFGLSKAANSLQEEAASRHTRLGLSEFGQGIMGTLEYAPPEQLGYGAEYGEPDGKSDVFSFGATLYHLLTGESPRFPNPRKLPDLRELHDLLFDCVELVPQNRLAIGELRLRLGKLLKSLAEVRPAHKKPKPGKRAALMKPSVKQVGAVFRDFLRDGSPGPEMVQIPAGRFRMGDIQGSGHYDDEKPVHEVSLDTFAIGVYPVVFAEYDKFAKATGNEKPSDNGWGRGRRPVINVSWEDAAKYCKWLSGQTEKEYRLLTEAEWEYACRAGSEADYCFGNDEKQLGEYVWYGANAGMGTHPAGKKKANAWGLYDMHGNVWEWVRDWFGDYPDEPLTDPRGPDSGSSRVVRGGSWASDGQGTRSAYRSGHSPVIRGMYLGFRFARGQ
ncbi:MAG: SUMF1/EgtB/PvdO family nonheme iron enzyme [Gammaproteobacteria bacterium]|nr:SUMF1/EgtB/PvdO family nonheme iron enzyme [Gammaproteobacteria bacterium]